jgi:hypothetical protein
MIVPDFIYETLSHTYNKPSDQFFYRTFIDFVAIDAYIIRESAITISNGTTGLSCWQVLF